MEKFYPIIYAAGSLGVLGLCFGVVLGVAAKIFAVQTDERIEQIMEVLPCANCGGCGFSGCGAFAEAVTRGLVSPSGCSVGGEKCAKEVSEIMGVDAAFEKTVARVRCLGTCDAAPNKYEYNGIESCHSANRINGGSKLCSYGCLGIGSCKAVCEYGAISIEEGIAVVDESKCTACGKCVETCPRRLIHVAMEKNRLFVACASKDKGGEMKNICSAGCIGCKLCEKACETKAINVSDNLAAISYDLCTQCGACAKKCPRKIIKTI